MTASVLRREHPRPPCPCGNCDVQSGFCDSHRTRLAQLRERYQADWKRKLGSTANGAREKPRAPACARPGCWEPRAMGESFCERCAAEGYVDGMGE